MLEGWTNRKKEYLIYMIATRMLYFERYVKNPNNRRPGNLITDQNQRLFLVNDELQKQLNNQINTKIKLSSFEIFSGMDVIIKSFSIDYMDEQVMIWLQSEISGAKTRSWFQISWRRLARAWKNLEQFEPRKHVAQNVLDDIWAFISVYYDSFHLMNPNFLNVKIIKNLKQDTYVLQKITETKF